MRLPEILRAPRGSEASLLIDQLLLSERVYRNWKTASEGAPTGYESNREREENMKSLFIAEYRRAEAAGEALPKVLLKMGHWHLYQGIGPAEIPTLGDFVNALAKTHERTSLQVAFFIVGKMGEFRSIAGVPWLAPFADAVPMDRSTVLDLHPIRALAYTRAGRDLDPKLKRLIFGFDAAFFLAAAHPGTHT